ncbi:exosortase N [Flavobacterium branchiophilum]|uniref:Exosortase N n=1 Tax=Flavobacterium branchiophilum TaxID=55197 RepID=A0A543G034_9FLAO|nr:exosortase N [Flavobacterium branchiophilum]OXA74668.1 exosortase N [Flavobacterium branchiophilum] [Flavobacterium branchiophilum NBRC 15030 = ATCC 35035]TQM39442.1 exosortase N [Flavobacterium branchiophilum]
MMLSYTKHFKNATLILLFTLVCINYYTIKKCFNTDFYGILLSMTLFVWGSQKTSFKIAYLLLPCLAILEFIAFKLHTKALHLLALMLLLCLVYYYITSQFSFVALINLLLFSTIFNAFFENFTVEIKQFLCKIVYESLKHFLNIQRIEGVNFFINQTKVSVDTACMGLSMFKMGFLAASFLLIIQEKKLQKQFDCSSIITFCLLAFILNIISNYFRIIVLLLLNCTTNNPLHHALGLLCFVIYQLLPMLYLIRFFVPKKQHPVLQPMRFPIITIVIVLVVFFITSLAVQIETKANILTNLDTQYPISKGIWINNEVFKIATPNKLIYIKTPIHKPLICWTGDGYKIIKSEEKQVGQQKIWCNIMEKNNKRYQSLWWYECGNQKTDSFLKVMTYKLFTNQPVRLINEVTVLP